MPTRSSATKAAEPPGHHCREQCERQREQRVAEADEFEEMADGFQHSKQISRKGAKARRRNRLNHEGHEGHKEVLEQSFLYSFVLFVSFVVKEFSFAPSRLGERLFGSPAFHEGVFDAELVADAGDDEVDEVGEGLDSVIPAGRGGQHDGAGFGDAAHVVDVGERQRCFARHEDQLAAFFQVDFGGALDEVAGGAGGDGAERGAAAGADDHAAGEERAAGHGGHEIVGGGK